MDQAKQVTNCVVLSIISSVCLIACSSENKIKTSEVDKENRIDKSLLLHEIKNETLKEYIAQYDSVYNEGEKGIMVVCRILSNGMRKYAVFYPSPSSIPSPPMIQCESINGRTIVMTFPDFIDDIELAEDKALEFSRDALSENAYKELKRVVNSNKNAECTEEIVTVNDKISINLIFDKDQNLIQVDTLGFM